MVEMMWTAVMLVGGVLVCSVIWAVVVLAPRPTRRRYRDDRS